MCFRFEEETSAITTGETNFVKEQIEVLSASSVPYKDSVVKAEHAMELTKIDAEVRNSLTYTPLPTDMLHI